MVDTCREEEDVVTISSTMVEVTGFNVLDNQTLGALVLICNSGCRYIEDIQNICMFNLCILDNAKGVTTYEQKEDELPVLMFGTEQIRP